MQQAQASEKTYAGEAPQDGAVDSSRAADSPANHSALPSARDLIKYPTPPEMVKWSNQWDKKNTKETGWYIELLDVLKLLDHYIPGTHVEAFQESENEDVVIAKAIITTFHSDGSVNRRVSAISSIARKNKFGVDAQAPSRVQGYAIKKVALLLGIGLDKNDIAERKRAGQRKDPNSNPNPAYRPDQGNRNGNQGRPQERQPDQGSQRPQAIRPQATAPQATAAQTGRTPPAQAVKRPGQEQQPSGRPQERQPGMDPLAGKRRQLIELSVQLGMTEQQVRERVPHSVPGSTLDNLNESQIDYLINVSLQRISQKKTAAA